jgi:HSP20 family molecular chaperone IbpA
MSEKTKVMPSVFFSHDDKGGKFRVDVELPGVDKQSITLDMRKDSFCVNATRDDIEYAGCYMLAHEVEPEKTEARFESGLLKITSPIRGWETKVTVKVQ